MSDEPFALSTIPAVLPAEADFDSIHAAVRASVRGRWFLEEYAKRNRNTDTAQVVAAIERIEAVIRGEHAQQVSQTMRIELLEMARAIAQTRAQVAETSKPRDVDAAPQPASDVAAAAQRLRDIAATMRERSIEPSTGEQIEALASAILSASSLHDPRDHRAQKLGEVLQYLEHRIDRLLDSETIASSEPAALVSALHDGQERDGGTEPDVAPRAQAFAPAAEETAAPVATLPLTPAVTDIQVGPPVAEVATATQPEPAEIKPADEPARDNRPERATLWTEFPAPAAAAPEAQDAPPALGFVQDDPINDGARTEATGIAETRIERVELDIEPLVVVPVNAVAERTAESNFELAPIPIDLVLDPPPPTSDDTVDEHAEAQSTADLSLIWAVEAPVQPVEMAADPVVANPNLGEIELEPLVVTQPVAAAAESDAQPMAATLDAAAEPAPTALASVTVVDIELDVLEATETSPQDTGGEPAAAVATQVESDLETLGVLAAGPAPAAADAAATTTSAATPADPVESDLLSNAWETAITAGPSKAAERDVESPPSMRAPPPPPAAAAVEPVAEEAPADFLLEPLTGSVATQPQACSAAHVDSGVLADIEEELFAGEDEPIPETASAVMPAAAAVAAPVAATAVRAAPKPMPRHAANDPLAAVKAMTDEERIALFT